MYKFFLSIFAVFIVGVLISKEIKEQNISSFLAGLHTEERVWVATKYNWNPVFDDESWRTDPQADLIDIIDYRGEFVYFPVHLDMSDPWNLFRLKPWIMRNAPRQYWEMFMARQDEYRKDTEKRYLEQGIDIQVVIDRGRYEDDQDKKIRIRKRLEERKRFKEQMDNYIEYLRDSSVY
jgi:hypothetical protein